MKYQPFVRIKLSKKGDQFETKWLRGRQVKLQRGVHESKRMAK